MAAPSGELVTGEPCDPERARPLHVLANLLESVVFGEPPMLDGILARAVVNQEQHVAPVRGDPTRRIEIPIVRHPLGFHLCSEGNFRQQASDLRHRHRRAPVHEMARLGSSKIRRVDIGGSENKSLRLPYEARLLQGERIEWWCVGDRERIAELLSAIHYIGALRRIGHGKLRLWDAPWVVDECEPWGDGFPLVRDGLPTRPLPLDFPGLQDPPLGYRVRTSPYFVSAHAELSAIPGY